MKQDDLLAIEEALPEIFREWKQRAETSLAWAEYSLLLHTFAEALRRAPLTMEKCASTDPAIAINQELMYLSDVLLFLFPDGEMRARSYKDA